MRARIEIRFRTRPASVAKSGGHFKQPRTAKPLFAITEVHGLKAGCDRSNYSNAKRLNVWRGQIGVSRATAGALQGRDAAIQVDLGIACGQTAKVVYLLLFSVFEQER